MNIVKNVSIFFLLILLVSCSSQSFTNLENNKKNDTISNVKKKISNKIGILVYE